jgi:hypothetical protein
MFDTDQNFAPARPTGRLRLYAYTIHDSHHDGLLKIGQTTKDVKVRVAQQLKTAAVDNYTIVLDEDAVRDDGSLITDHSVRKRLKDKGFDNPQLEWMRCSIDDVRTAITELRTGTALSGTHHATFPLRSEQAEAVEKTLHYYHSIWEENPAASPSFLWNAKMRFGKTFTAYHLAKRLDARKILVVTYKTAVEDSWRTDLESHADFDGWQFASRASGADPTALDPARPFVYFGSFQDLLGTDKAGNIKAKNQWLHTVPWDLVIFDEYHFGSWRDRAKELFEGEDVEVARKEVALEYGSGLDVFHEEKGELKETESDFLPLTSKAFLYLSGTPFRALAEGEFIEEQIFNWTYSDEQRAKVEFVAEPGDRNPYAALPEMRLFTYQMPEELVAIASQGEFDEFDLNTFFATTGTLGDAEFVHTDEVQSWLDIIRGKHAPTQVDNLKMGSSRPPFPYSDSRLLPYLQHSFWLLPNVAACYAMEKLLTDRHNTYWHTYDVVNVAGPKTGIGVEALPPVRKAIGNGRYTSTITLSCGKLTTGVTVPEWSSIFMLKNLSAPETYFQAAFRVQSPWSISNPNGDNPNEEEILKPVCFVFDFAPTRALRQLAEYSDGLSPDSPNPEKAVEELVNFLPVLAYDGSNMVVVDPGDILDVAMSGTSATLLARKWEAALLVNVDNATLQKLLDNPEAMRAIENIEGFRALGDNAIETVINKSEKVKKLKEKGDDLSDTEKKELTAEEKEYRAKRKEIQKKLIKFAARIPVFMYLTDYRENRLRDVIEKLEPELFRSVTGLTIEDFRLLVSLNLFNSSHMDKAVLAFRRYEDSSLSYTGIESHPGLKHYGLFNTVVAREPESA